MRTKHTIPSRPFFGLALAAIGVAATLVQAGPSKESGPAASSAAFALDLYEQLALERKDENLALSPFSVHTALAMTSAGARGETLRQMERVLHLEPGAGGSAPTHAALGGLVPELTAGARPEEERPFRLVVSNGLWGQKDYPFHASFRELVTRSYGAELGHADFVNAAEEARRTINRAIGRETHGKIEELLAPGALDSLTRLVLTNAIYFKSDWAYPFGKDRTHRAPFHPAPGRSVDVAMMSQTRSFDYAETEELQAVELPYRGGRLSMLVVLPRRLDGLSAVERSLASQGLAPTLGALVPRAVKLALPRFSVTGRLSLPRTLATLGMIDAFDSGRADLSGIADIEKLSLKDVVHQAVVEVDEQGTEAAAATAVVVQTVSARVEEPVAFDADHPFLFVIRHEPSGVILFMGRVSNPAV
jgi:serpin B